MPAAERPPPASSVLQRRLRSSPTRAWARETSASAGARPAIERERIMRGLLERRSRAPFPGGMRSIATGEEGDGEVEEVLRVDRVVAVEVGEWIGGEERGEEVEEVLRVEDAVGVEVGRAWRT